MSCIFLVSHFIEFTKVFILCILLGIQYSNERAMIAMNGSGSEGKEHSF